MLKFYMNKIKTNAKNNFNKFEKFKKNNNNINLAESLNKIKYNLKNSNINSFSYYKKYQDEFKNQYNSFKKNYTQDNVNNNYNINDKPSAYKKFVNMLSSSLKKLTNYISNKSDNLLSWDQNKIDMSLNNKNNNENKSLNIVSKLSNSIIAPVAKTINYIIKPIKDMFSGVIIRKETFNNALTIVKNYLIIIKNKSHKRYLVIKNKALLFIENNSNKEQRLNYINYLKSINNKIINVSKNSKLTYYSNRIKENVNFEKTKLFLKNKLENSIIFSLINVNFTKFDNYLKSDKYERKFIDLKHNLSSFFKNKANFNIKSQLHNKKFNFNSFDKIKYTVLLIVTSYIIYNIINYVIFRRRNNKLDNKYSEINNLIVNLENQNKEVMENNKVLKAILDDNIDNSNYKTNYLKMNSNKGTKDEYNNNLIDYINREIDRKKL